jgi:hypothetical protein
MVLAVRSSVKPPVQSDAPISQPPMIFVLPRLPTRMTGGVVLNHAVVSAILREQGSAGYGAHTPGLVESAKSTINPFQQPQIPRLAFFISLNSFSCGAHSSGSLCACFISLCCLAYRLSLHGPVDRCLRLFLPY